MSLRSFVGVSKPSLALTVVLGLIFSIASDARAQGGDKAAPAKSRPTGQLKVVTGQPRSYVYINNVLHG
ncbi:MAG TPA: hypothetical protein VFO63_02935, partial [Blastocatellia bacterium]|nr:hypothetical protein [Blastocatellia bacterium]